MYRHCIYCSADLGTNEALENFPVGRTVAFDAAKGRLWAVCRKCARWNLAPIEERWEAWRTRSGATRRRGCACGELRQHRAEVSTILPV
jgi:hypothetical protein